MTAWKRDTREPFAGNDDFWVSVGSSVDAFVTLLIAAGLTLAFGYVAAVAFVIPLALLIRAGITGRRSGRITRSLFTSQQEWRLAEREAVWSVLPRAVLRPRHLHRA